MRFADKLFERLANYTEVVFYVPGGGAMFLNDALGQSGLEAVSCLTEEIAGIAAVGYAAFGGRLGGCLVTSGPGGLGAVRACGAAWTDSYPVLFISGQVKREQMAQGQRTRGPQEIDILGVVGKIVKRYSMTDDVTYLIEGALTGRAGPVWLDVPLDVQAEEI